MREFLALMEAPAHICTDRFVSCPQDLSGGEREYKWVNADFFRQDLDLVLSCFRAALIGSQIFSLQTTIWTLPRRTSP